MCWDLGQATTMLGPWKGTWWDLAGGHSAAVWQRDRGNRRGGREGVSWCLVVRVCCFHGRGPSSTRSGGLRSRKLHGKERRLSVGWSGAGEG